MSHRWWKVTLFCRGPYYTVPHIKLYYLKNRGELFIFCTHCLSISLYSDSGTLFCWKSIGGTGTSPSPPPPHSSPPPTWSQSRTGNFINKNIFRFLQCCGSVTFWYRYGSGSADPYLSGYQIWPRILHFHQWPTRWQKNVFLLFTFEMNIFIIFQR